MINKIKKYTLFFAVTLNIVASAFFIRSDYIRFSNADDSLVMATLGVWFAGVSGILWVLYGALLLFTRLRRK